MENGRPPEQEKAIIDEAIVNINKGLEWPRSLKINGDRTKVVYNMGTNMYDESGGGTLIDIDYYIFPAERLNTLVFKAFEKKAGFRGIHAKGFRNTNIENWPYGMINGFSEHRHREPVTLHLMLTIKDGQSIFKINETGKKKED
jgi:hypothetical protein